MDKDIVISIKTVLFSILLIIGCYVLYRLGPILRILLISLLIVFSTEPLIKYVMRGTLFNRPISRSIAVVVAYILLIAIFAGAVTVVLPPFFMQSQTLLKSISDFFTQLKITQNGAFTLPDLLPQASSISGGVVGVTLAIFSNVATVFSVFIVSIYMSLDWEDLKRRFANLFSRKYNEEVLDGIEEVEVNIGHWIKGQLILMFVIGLFSFIGLTILDVDYAIALSLISGLLEVVPMIGPIISAVLAAIVGFGQAPAKGLAVIILFTVIQQVENNILVPQVMKKVSGFSPLFVLLAILIGSEFFGVSGAVMAIPVAMMLAVVARRSLRFKA